MPFGRGRSALSPGIRYRRSGAAFCVDEGASPASIRLGAASAASSERGIRNADMGSALDITHGFQSAPGQLDEEVVGFVQRVDAERPQWTALSRSSCPRSSLSRPGDGDVWWRAGPIPLHELKIGVGKHFASTERAAGPQGVARLGCHDVAHAMFRQCAHVDHGLEQSLRGIVVEAVGEGPSCGGQVSSMTRRAMIRAVHSAGCS